MTIHPASRIIRAWRGSSERFARECLRCEPDAWQIEVMQAWDRGDQRLAMQACKGPGKTALLAILIWHFLATRPHPKVAATSISGDNLSDGLWAELAKWQQRSPFLQQAFRWQATRIVAADHPETWWASARTWSRSADATQQGQTLAGLHADHILFVLDEAGAVPGAVLNAAEAALATGTECRIVMAGNPIETDGALGRACLRDRHLWTVIEITGDPESPRRASRIDIQWARDQIAQYGRDNPWVLANVYGRFAPSSPLSFIPLDLVEAAVQREPVAHIHDPLVLGVEVARYGDDEAGICVRKGRDARTWPWDYYRHIDTMQLAAHVIERQMQYGADAVFVDGGGIGGGVVDRCRQLRLNVHDVQFGARADRVQLPGAERMVYANKAAEMWGAMRDWLKVGSIPDDPVLHAQLTSRRYAYIQREGRDAIALEPKDNLKQRGLSSPDRADMLALTFAYPVAAHVSAGVGPAGQATPQSLGQRQRTVITDYDPFAIP